MASLEPLVCVCGFYASTKTNNMCSQCYKDSVLKCSFAGGVLKKETKREETEVAEPPAQVGVVVPLQSGRKRCDVCKRRLPLTSMACCCGLRFCETHRYPEDHGCSYDYKTEARKALAKKLVRVPHVKFQKM